MCKVETVFGGVCKHQVLPKIMLAISPINQEAVVGSTCQHPLPGCEENRSPSPPRLLSLRAQPVDAAWGLVPCTSNNYSTLILAHLWPMKSRPNSGACVWGEEMEAGPKLP